MHTGAPQNARYNSTQSRQWEYTEMLAALESEGNLNIAIKFSFQVFTGVCRQVCKMHKRQKKSNVRLSSVSKFLQKHKELHNEFMEFFKNSRTFSKYHE